MKLRNLRNTAYQILSLEEAQDELDSGNEFIYSVTCSQSNGNFGFTPSLLSRGPNGSNGQTIYLEEMEHPNVISLQKLSEKDFPFFNVPKKAKSPVSNTECDLLKIINKVQSLRSLYELIESEVEIHSDQILKIECVIDDLLDDQNGISEEIDSLTEELLNYKK